MCGAGVETQMSLIHSLPNDEINIHILRQEKNLNILSASLDFLFLSSVDYASALCINQISSMAGIPAQL